MRNLVNIVIVLFVCLNWDSTEAGEVDFHTVELSSLFSSSLACDVPSPKAKGNSIYVVHQYGPCSTTSLARASPDHADILSQDQARVNYIHSKLSKKSIDQVQQSQSTKLPAKDGMMLGSGNYFVPIGIGTPKHDLSLVFDTGSDLSWVQCEPCNGHKSCYSQKEPIFNPSSSSSYSNISCSSPVCASLTSAGIDHACSASSCVYGTGYADNSVSIGFLATEKFTLTESDVFDGFNFGCGENNQGLFQGVAGILGLGRGKLSFPSQTATKYNKIFSYCLPSSPSYTGYLTFGSAGISRSVKFTPISTVTRDPSFYGLDIVGISVGGKKLDIPLPVFSNPGAVIDSGAVITRLPPKAYEALTTAFKEQMSNYTLTSSRRSKMDPCYDFTGLEKVMVPKISFSFNGGAVVELGAEGVLYPFDISEVCLAFLGNSDDEKIAIFGNVQQKTLQVVYDGPGNRVGFAPNGCT